MMPRPREFDIEEVLQNAMKVFWRRGYIAASMAEIYGATGLKPGNLYANFRDKETLFRRAFEAYTAQFRATLPTDCEGAAAIVAWLGTQARLATDDRECKGCLIINTIVERDAHSPATQRLVDARLAEIRAFFLENLDIAEKRGELADTVPGAQRADQLTGAVVAIMALARGGATPEMIWNVADAAAGAIFPGIRVPRTPKPESAAP